MQTRPVVKAGFVVIAVAATIGSAAGCSEQDEARDIAHPVAAAVAQLRDAFADEDVAAICGRMTKPAQKQAGEVAHGDATTCERDLRRAFKIVEDGDGWSEEKPVVRRVEVRGDWATAKLKHGAWIADVPLSRERGIWKLAGFFGADPAKFERMTNAWRGRPYPPATGKPLEAVDAGGNPCPDLSDERYPMLSGGCSFKVSTESAPIRMLTPFGDFKFSDCSVEYRVLVDRSGRTASDQWDFENDEQPGCSDIRPCVGGQNYLPWKGRLASDGDGGYLHRMDMCLRTCIGQFAGNFTMRLVRDDDGWRVEPTYQGDTGFKIDGDLAVSTLGFDLRND